jgi:hypothetical protein
MRSRLAMTDAVLELILLFVIATKLEWTCVQLVSRQLKQCATSIHVVSRFFERWRFSANLRANTLPAKYSTWPLNVLVSRCASSGYDSPTTLDLPLSTAQLCLYRHSVSDSCAENLVLLQRLTHLELHQSYITSPLMFALLLMPLTKLRIRECVDFTDAILTVMAGNLTKLIYLELFANRDVTDVGLNAILQANPTMQELVLIQLAGVTGNGVNYPRTLQSMTLRYMAGLTDASFQQLRELNQLRSLTLEGIHNVTAAVLLPLVDLPALQDLSMIDCNGPPSSTRTRLPPQLKSLDLRKTQLLLQAEVGLERLERLCLSVVTDELSLSVAHLLPASLRGLSLAGSPALTDLGLSAVLTNLVNLQTLNLTDCVNITITELAAALAFKGLVDLRTLVLRGCTRITDDGMATVCKLVSLQSLDMSGCRLITEVGFNKLSSLQNLRDLDLRDCDVQPEHNKTRWPKVVVVFGSRRANYYANYYGGRTRPVC